MTDIFDFEDFHIYLSAYYEEKKRQNRNYSFTVMAQQFGIPDRTFVHHIVRIVRTKLPAPYIIKISEALRLTKRETEALKKRIRTLVEHDTGADRVFLYQLILVPLTKITTKT